MGFLIRKLLLKIASMSKRASVVYCIVLTLIFLVGIAVFLTGILFVIPGEVLPDFAIACLTIGSLMIIAVLAVVALTSVASNYIETEKESHGEEDSGSLS